MSIQSSSEPNGYGFTVGEFDGDHKGVYIESVSACRNRRMFLSADSLKITPGGIAAQSEVTLNDIIMSINGKPAVGMRKSEAMQLLQIMAASGQVSTSTRLDNTPM